MPQADLDRLSRNAVQNAAPAPPTGFGENFRAELDRTLHTNLTVSKSYSLAEAYEEYIDAAEQATGRKFTNPIAQSQVGTRVGSTAIRKQFEQSLFEELTELGFEGVMTPAELQERADELALAAEENANQISDTATTAGAFGGFAGQTVGVLSDPPIVSSMFLGAPLATGILKTAATEALIAGGVEAAIQPIIQSERDRIGLEAGFMQGLENVAFAAAGGAIFGGAIKGLMEIGQQGRGAITRLRNSITDKKSPQVNQDADALLRRIDNVESSNPFEVSNRGMAEHVRLYDEALTAVQTGRKADLKSTTAPIKEFEPIEFKLKARDVPETEIRMKAGEVAQVARNLMEEVAALAPEEVPPVQRAAPEPEPPKRTTEELVKEADAADQAMEAGVRGSIDQDEAFGKQTVALADEDGVISTKPVKQVMDELDEEAAAVAEFEGCLA